MSYACDVCNRTFDYPSILKLHYMSHTGEKLFQCKFCPKRFSYEAHLIVHKQIHLQKKEHVGEHCKETFLLKSSQEVLHTDDRKNKTCLMEASCSKNGLDRQNVAFKPDKLHTCVICNEVFSKECDLNLHILTHEDQKPLLIDKNCDENNFSVPYSFRIKRRLFICDTCGEAFSTKKNFKMHKRDHRKKKAFECDICGKLFSRKDRLDIHYRVHTNEKPFEYHGRGKNFFRNSNVNYRIIHTNKRLLTCSICGTLISRKEKLKLHYRVHKTAEPLCVINAIKNLRGLSI